MRSGRLARLTGVSTDRLRHYEPLGLLARPPRTGANYRDYAPPCQERVNLIQRALRTGFSLPELKHILAGRDRGGAPCLRVRELLKSKIGDIDRHIKGLQVLREDLNRLSKVWDKRLSSTKLKEQIRYEYAETDRGARIRIVAATQEATDAVHAFLLFQIVDRQTGDAPNISGDVPKT